MNSQYFSKIDVENGVMSKFIAELCAQCYSTEDTKNLILIEPEDLGAFSVNWIQSSWKHREDYETFQEVGADEKVVHQLILPDNTIFWVENEEEEQEALRQWQEDHPTWDLHKFGWMLKKEYSNGGINR